MKNAEEMAQQESGILNHEITPRDRLQKQMVLAEELYLRNHPDQVVDVGNHDTRNAIMNEWSNIDGDMSKSFSAYFRDLENTLLACPGHTERGKTILDITIDDLMAFKETGAIPLDWL